MSHTVSREQATTKHARLRAWVEEIAALTRPTRSTGATGRPRSTSGWQHSRRGRHLPRLSDASARTPTWRSPIRVTWRASRSGRTSAPSTSPTPGRRTTGRARRDARPAGAVQRLDARTHDVRRALLDGPARFADREDRRAADRFGLCRVSMRIMTRMGTPLGVLGDGGEWVPCLHSVGMPLDRGAGRAVAV